MVYTWLSNSNRFLFQLFFPLTCIKFVLKITKLKLTSLFLMSSFSFKISIFHNVFKLIQSFCVNFKRWLVQAIGRLMKVVVIIHSWCEFKIKCDTPFTVHQQITIFNNVMSIQNTHSQSLASSDNFVKMFQKLLLFLRAKTI